MFNSIGINRVGGNALTIISLFIFATPVFGDAVIGRWCDEPVPAMPAINKIMEMIHTEEGAFELRLETEDGSTHSVALEKISAEVYRQVGSTWGDKYRIMATGGNLELSDQDGVIRMARRLKETPARGECF